jgi:hypothetical protein
MPSDNKTTWLPFQNFQAVHSGIGLDLSFPKSPQELAQRQD